MKVVSFRLTKILAERLKEAEEKVESINLNSNFNLDAPKKEPSQPSNSQTLFSIEFTNSYQYDIYARTEIKGIIYFVINNSDSKLLSEVEVSKKINNKPLKKLLIDYTLRKIHVLTLSLEEKLNLPFHIQSPVVSITSPQDNDEEQSSS
ncbi:hypothetical protein COU57_00725 [Candidatus Pacearchaeota archaeon CG10_big_fil_rev_8_21_14_0_10_32_14]|nr:MAG: hypothetical protein COU57_00725 [Candidatus Pacearchaeota archaeon CG10_big_fil_rev_8_21_14_0_10_32_14]